MAATPAMDTADQAVSDRLVAYLIDFVLLSVLAFVVWLVGIGIQMMILGASNSMEAGGGGAMAAGLGAIVVRLGVWTVIGGSVFGYFAYLDADGQTVGKRVADVVVANTDGSPAGRKSAAVRTAVLLAPLPVIAGASTLLSWVGFLLTFWLTFVWLAVEAVVLYVSDDHQRIGDRLAGTMVVKTTSAAGADGESARTAATEAAVGNA